MSLFNLKSSLWLASRAWAIGCCFWLWYWPLVSIWTGLMKGLVLLLSVPRIGGLCNSKPRFCFSQFSFWLSVWMLGSGLSYARLWVDVSCFEAGIFMALCVIQPDTSMSLNSAVVLWLLIKYELSVLWLRMLWLIRIATVEAVTITWKWVNRDCNITI